MALRHQVDEPLRTTDTAYPIHQDTKAKPKKDKDSKAPKPKPKQDSKEKPKGQKLGRNGKPITCHRCNKLGHYLSDCTNNPFCSRCNVSGHCILDCTAAPKSTTTSSSTTSSSSEPNETCYIINTELINFHCPSKYCNLMETQEISPFKPLSQKQYAFPTDIGNVAMSTIRIDNQSGLSICSVDLLTNVVDIPQSNWISVSGVVKGASMWVKKKGMLLGCIEVYAHESPPANILSFGEMEDLYHVYETRNDNDKRCIMLDTPHFSLSFERHDDARVYTCDISHLLQSHGVYYTAKAATHSYPITPTEQKRAKMLMDLWVRCERPGFEEFRKMLPGIADTDYTDLDIKNAKMLYDFKDEVSVCAKETKHTAKLVPPSSVPNIVTPSYLVSDVVYVSQLCYMLTSLVRPIDALLTTHIKTLEADECQRAILEQVRLLHGKKVRVDAVYVDPARSLMCLEGNLGEINVKIGGAGDHMSPLDIRIRNTRAIVRMAYSELPFKLPPPMYSYLWKYGITRKNTRVSTHSLDPVSPATHLTGRRPSQLVDFALRFGDYCIVNTTTLPPNSLASRGLETIALYPQIGVHNTWVFLNIATGKLVLRSRWTKLAMPESAKKALYEVMGTTSDQLLIPYQLGDEDNDSDPEDNVMQNTIDAEEHNTGEMSDHDREEPAVVGQDFGGDGEEGIESIDDREGIGDGEELHHHHNPTTNTHPRINTRVRKTLRSSLADMDTDQDNSQNEAYVIKTDQMDRMSVSQCISLFGAESTNLAILVEIRNLFTPTKKVFRPYTPDRDSKTKFTTVGSSMFLKAKFDPNGKFIKLKARIVGWGNQQDDEDYPAESRSSPTVRWESWMIVLAIACEQGRRAASMDVDGAYFEATTEKSVKPVSVRFNKYLTTLISQEYPEYTSHIQNGMLTAEALRALYGLVESGKLWHNTVSEILRKLGFTPNEFDPCVWNKDVDGKQLTVVIFVDDLFATHINIIVLKKLHKDLLQYLKGVSYNDDRKLSYLGVQVEIMLGKIVVSMPGYIDDLVKMYPDAKVCTTPATIDLFNVDDSALLPKPECDKFHTMVAKLLYLCIRVLHEVSIAVAFLCGRVREPNVSDNNKLLRVVGYIKHVGKAEVILRRSGSLDVHCYIDASFGCHEDGKSHTGAVVFVGNCPVYVSSTKQKMVAANSTEAELIGASDKICKCTWSGNFLNSQGHGDISKFVYQDNEAAIRMATTGAGKSRTIHLKVRKFAMKELIDGGDVSMYYANTHRMWADVLTKPLMGKPFKVMSDVVNGLCEDV